MRRTTRKIAIISATGVAAAALVTTSTTTAHAASGCRDAHFTRAGSEAYWCNNTAPTGVYESISYTYGRGQVGTLKSNPSWFICKTDDGEYNGEANGPHPYRWLLTEADTPAGVWGWVPDKHVISETNPLPNCW